MVHLTEKPVELARRDIEVSSRGGPGENVLDLFGGSGSTLIGAEMTAPPRRAFLMELDTLYCDVIVQPPTLGEVHGPQGSSVANDNGLSVCRGRRCFLFSCRSTKTYAAPRSVQAAMVACACSLQGTRSPVGETHRIHT